jgi:hypothetical protein
MVYKVLDGTDMIGEFFGKAQSVTDEAGDALPQRVSEALNMIGFPGVLGDGFVSCRRNDPGVGFSGVSEKFRAVERLLIVISALAGVVKKTKVG